MTQSGHYVFAGGGSGGHLTPSMAVAESVLKRQPDARITFFVSGRSIDRTVLSTAAVVNDPRCTVVPLTVTQPPGARPSGWRHAAALWSSFRTCLAWLKQHPASVLMSTGAFAAVPGLLAARWLRIPIVLFEANARAGKVNRWFSRWATLRLSGWPDVDDIDFYEPIGMPLRSEFEAQSLGSDGNSLLVLGGSQGSRRLNELFVTASADISLPSNWDIIHQTGQQPLSVPRALALSERVRRKEFLDNPAEMLQEASIVISRAGAVTLAELRACGCAAILVPLTHAAEAHQVTNADWLASRGAAVVIDEQNPDAVSQLAVTLQQLIEDSDRRTEMSNNIHALHQPQAAERIVDRLIELCDVL